MSKEIIVAAVGDLIMKPMLVRLLHAGGKRSGSAGQDKVPYDFGHLFEPVSRYLQEADLTIGNLETTLAGGTDVSYTKSKRQNGNPVFKSPDGFATALKAAGFDVLATANNHCMDYGIRGLKRTLDVLDRCGLAHTGTYRSGEESKSLCIRDVEGVRIGILSYTRDTNGIPVPKDQAAGVNKLARSRIANDLKRMRAKSDFIIVCMHTGKEYHRRPSLQQKELVSYLFRQGADVVLGAHPHVLQPAVCRTVKDVNGRTRRRLAIYSLGNFISTRLHGLDDALTGMIARVKLRKTSDGSVRLAGFDYVPTWVSIEKDGGRHPCQVVPLRPALLASDRGPAGQKVRMNRAYRRAQRMYQGVLPLLEELPDAGSAPESRIASVTDVPIEEPADAGSAQESRTASEPDVPVEEPPGSGAPPDSRTASEPDAPAIMDSP
ncbi:CapA family protein [Paenibacillus humicola]|uniref:CapA family protein n=1 Tax=Paenibacillus humicola TaxID=3110540 RepID=UPI00237B46CF|nr:CapA family protein [Paenibacillus humicola]